MRKQSLTRAGVLQVLFFLNVYAFFPSFSHAAEESSEWKIVMTYAGGYSPIKEVQIEILKTADHISYTAKKSYYDNTPPEEKNGEVTAEKFKELTGQLEKNQAWTLSDLTEYVATDGFTYHVEIQNAGKQHVFEVYFPELQKDKRYQNIIDAIHSVAGDL